MAETIRDVITRNPKALQSADSAVEAARAMREEEPRRVVASTARKTSTRRCV
jgi:CBS domain-containing protein